MAITPDTNILVRVVVLDDPAQTDRARAELSAAEAVFITLPALCEFCWVLRSRYRFSPADIADAVSSLTEASNTVVDAVAVGLAMLSAGGDFADGVIAEQGRQRGGTIFVSFDRKAVSRLSTLGVAARVVEA